MRASVGRVESWRGVDHEVRSVVGSPTTDLVAAPYRCPGCDQEIVRSSPHVVVWPAEPGGVEYRRHWHAVCWDARDRREPTAKRW